MPYEETNFVKRGKQSLINNNLKKKNLFEIPLLWILLLQILGCASFMHGYTTRKAMGWRYYL